jgi:hypothetical protein
LPRKNTEPEELEQPKKRPADSLSTNDRKLAGLLTFMGWTGKLVDSVDRGLVSAAVYLLQQAGLDVAYKFNNSVVGPYSEGLYKVLTRLRTERNLFEKGEKPSPNVQKWAQVLLEAYTNNSNVYIIDAAGMIYYRMVESDTDFEAASGTLKATGLSSYVDAKAPAEKLLDDLGLMEEEEDGV